MSSGLPDPLWIGDPDDDFAALLAGEVPLADELQPDDDEVPTDAGSHSCGFDPDTFVEEVRESIGVQAIDALAEVPLSAFLEASRHDVLHHLRIEADQSGEQFLTGIVFTTRGPIVLVSVSFS